MMVATDSLGFEGYIVILMQLVKIVMPMDEAERLLSLQLALKCSDLGHTTASLPVHLKWVSKLEEEVRTIATQFTQVID